MPKYAYLLLLALSVSSLTLSCKKDGDPTPACTAPTADKNIVGTWSAAISAQGQKANGPVTFKSDGTYDDKGLLLDGGFGGTPTARTYEVKNNQVVLKLSESSGFISTKYDITSNECNKIGLSLAGLGTVTLTR